MDIMKLFFWVILLLISCENTSLKNMEASINNKSFSSLQNSNSFINTLYKGKKLFKETSKGYLKFAYTVDTIKKIINTESAGNIQNFKIKYNLELFDDKNISMNRRSKFIQGADYTYLKSSFAINDNEIDLKEKKCANCEVELVPEPITLWHGSNEYPTIKYYKLDVNKEIFLIQGISFYCNGSNCTSYEVIILQKQNKKLSINSLYYIDNSLIDFDEILLFDMNGDSNPEIYVPNNRNNELEIYSIMFADLIKY